MKRKKSQIKSDKAKYNLTMKPDTRERIRDRAYEEGISTSVWIERACRRELELTRGGK